jgi:OPA family glycerol-3-phosphate transporter-like MFS transporter
MIKAVFEWFRPPPFRPRQSPEAIARLYPLFRWRVFESAFLAYTVFYMVRNNLAPIQKEMGSALGYDKAMLGSILAGTAIAYGIGKFVMGSLSDRCDMRKYLMVGLSLTAVINLLFGSASSYAVHFALWTMNGVAQGMAGGPCHRVLAHWYSVRERGTVFAFWNISHNVGGAIAGVLAVQSMEILGWRGAFYVPALIALCGVVYLAFRMYDTPQSEGMPPVEEYKNDYPPDETEPHERTLTLHEAFFDYILPNKMLWLVAVANLFVQVARYCMVDWGPTYLKEVKGATAMQGGMSTLLLEGAGIAGMLTMGWLSDRMGGRRGRVSALAMMALVVAFVCLVLTPKEWLVADLVLFAVIGFFVYTPVMMLGVMSLDLTSKKATGTALGFVGLFGYLGRVIQAQGLGWIAQNHGWETGLISILGAVLIGAGLLLFTWNIRPRG